MIDFIIPGKPVPMPRPRFTRNGHTYNPPKAQLKKKEISILARNEMTRRSVGITDRAVTLEINCYFEPPKSYTLKKLKQISNGQLQYIKKPDVDNLAKTVLDALNGIAYNDDSQVIKMIVSKEYSDTAHTKVFVQEV